MIGFAQSRNLLDGFSTGFWGTEGMDSWHMADWQAFAVPRY
jgi:hypothetical protein